MVLKLVRTAEVVAVVAESETNLSQAAGRGTMSLLVTTEVVGSGEENMTMNLQDADQMAAETKETRGMNDALVMMSAAALVMTHVIAAGLYPTLLAVLSPTLLVAPSPTHPAEEVTTREPLHHEMLQLKTKVERKDGEEEEKKRMMVMLVAAGIEKRNLGSQQLMSSSRRS